MLKKIILGTIGALTISLFSIGTTFAANPPGTGQPGAPAVSCGSGNAVIQPNGFLTQGFANAANNYAGSPGTPSAENSNSTHSISQYDVACFQLTSK